jgi:anionic cell wall polymer biosynthesis LytR-Cps2A-Psr (LCP) family protein
MLMQKKIDYYIEIRPAAITKMVDLLGGVYLFVDKDMYYVDHAQNLNINLKKGWQKLSGKQAHDYIRYRNDIYGDIGRIGRHQIFLKALLQALIRPSNLVKAPFVIQTVLREIDTDLPLSQTVRILNLSRNFSINDLRTTMVSGEVSYLKEAGSVWLPDSIAIKTTAEQLF